LNSPILIKELALLVSKPDSWRQAGVIRRLRGTRDPWEQLGLARAAGREEVNRVYRKMAILLHPDKTGVEGAQEAFKQLGQARSAILKTFRD
jgi:DnaJ family protein C protein 27